MRRKVCGIPDPRLLMLLVFHERGRQTLLGWPLSQRFLVERKFRRITYAPTRISLYIYVVNRTNTTRCALINSKYADNLNPGRLGENNRLGDESQWGLYISLFHPPHVIMRYCSYVRLKRVKLGTYCMRVGYVQR